MRYSINKIILTLFLLGILMNIRCFLKKEYQYLPIYIDGDWTIINNKGCEWELANQFEIITPFTEGIAIIKEKNNFGFINQTGDIILKPNYSVSPFNNGMAHIVHRKRSYYINQKGEKIFETTGYNEALYFNDNILHIERNDSSIFFDKTGKVIFSCPYQYSSYSKEDGIIKVWDGDTTAYYDNSGKLLNKFEGLGHSDYSEGKILVDNSYFINLKGKVVIKNKGRMASDFNSNRAVVKKVSPDNRRYSLIDTTGELVKPFLFEEIKDFRYDVAPAAIDEKWGLIDIDGNWILEPIFSGLKVFDEEHLIFVKGNMWGYTTLLGEVIWEGNLEDLSEYDLFIWKEYIWGKPSFD